VKSVSPPMAICEMPQPWNGRPCQPRSFGSSARSCSISVRTASSKARASAVGYRCGSTR
jgi:hypothetical protein